MPPEQSKLELACEGAVGSAVPGKMRLGLNE